MIKGRGKIAVVGDDGRLFYAAKRLGELGYESAAYGFSRADAALTRAATLADALSGADAVILPIPITRDKKTLATLPSVELAELVKLLTPDQTVYAGCVDRVENLFSDKDFRVVDYDLCDEYAYPNSLATAEATVALAIEHFEKMLCDCTVAIYGYGRIARCLAPLLRAFGANVFVFARSQGARRMAASDGCSVSDFASPAAPFADILINTVPAYVLPDPSELLAKGGLLIELAGVKREKICGIKVLPAPSLPGKYSPRSMGERLAAMIDKMTDNKAFRTY